MKLSKAEIILLISFCYYMIVGMVSLILFAVFMRNLDDLENELKNYFVCEENRSIMDDPCDRSRWIKISDIILSPAGIVILLFYPAIHLAFFLNIKTLWKKCKKVITRPKTLEVTQTECTVLENSSI